MKSMWPNSHQYFPLNVPSRTLESVLLEAHFEQHFIDT